MVPRTYKPIESFKPPRIHSTRVVPEWVNGKPPQRLAISKEEYLFPVTLSTEESNSSVVLSNTGFLPMEITSARLVAGSAVFFGEYLIPFVLLPGETENIELTFSPTEAGSFTDSLVITVVDYPAITLPIYGEAYST